MRHPPTPIPSPQGGGGPHPAPAGYRPRRHARGLCSLRWGAARTSPPPCGEGMGVGGTRAVPCHEVTR